MELADIQLHGNRLCRDHFAPEDFYDHLVSGGHCTLKPDSVPSIGTLFKDENVQVSGTSLEWETNKHIDSHNLYLEGNNYVLYIFLKY